MTTPAPRSTDRREMVWANVRGTLFCGKSFSDMEPAFLEVVLKTVSAKILNADF